MTVSKFPVGLPAQHPTKAYWQTPPHKIADHRTTPDLPSFSKYVIIGSGITGASIALKILNNEPEAQIVILEARQAASGATGRNGGHCRAGRYLDFKNDVENFGIEEALKLEMLEEANVKNVGEFIKGHKIDCDLRDVETVDIFTDRLQLDDCLASLKARKEAFKGKLEAKILTKHRVWSEEETRKELLIPEGVGAVSFPAYALSPYKFACAVLDMSINKGVNLQTNTPVVEVAQMPIHSGTKWLISTAERGIITAEKVILATNAYTAALFPGLDEWIIPTRAQVAAVRPGTKIAGNPALLRTCGLYSALSGDYMQTRAPGYSGEGDVIVGGGRSLGNHKEQPVLDDSTIHPVISKYLTHAAARYFGKENWGEDGEVLQEWTGIMGYTQDQQPVVGEAPGQKGLWICAGFNGHGMALAFQSAEACVQMIMGKAAEVENWLPSCYKLERVPNISRSMIS